MTTLPLHPLADVIPPASPDDMRALAASIQAVGQVEPIRTWQGQIIDGRHRMKACEELGIEPIFREVLPEEVGGGTDEALLAFVLALNINRRHATTSQRALAAAKVVTTDGAGRPEKGSKDPITIEKSANLFNVSARSVKRARQLINEADHRVVDLVARGVMTLNAALESHEQLSAMAAEQEANGMDADFEKLAKEIDRLKRTNSKLRKQNKDLAAAGADQGAQAKVYAAELETTKAELARVQGQLDAADKGMSVAPPQIQYRQDPEKDRLLDEKDALIAKLEEAKKEAEHKAKYNESLLKKADLQLVDKANRLAKLEGPAEFLTVFSAEYLDESATRVQGAIGASKRLGQPLPPETMRRVEAVRDLLDDLLNLSRDMSAMDAEKTQPALEVNP